MLRLVHPTPTTTPDETPIDIRPPVDHEARIRAEQERENATRAAVAALRPAWAQALIVAECEHDDCDSQSDYFNTKTSRIVALAWSTAHARSLSRAAQGRRALRGDAPPWPGLQPRHRERDPAG
jgi:hypothetical protein